MISKRISLFNRPGPPIKIHTLKTLWAHMTAMVDKDTRKTLQKEIDLTDNECAFICITSIDPEYFPWMLIEQTDFVKWFTTDFSGEGDTEKQEEEDFLNDKVADWDEATSLALELSALGRSKDLQKIQDMEWWENQRFKNVGEGLLNKFQTDKKLYKNMEKLFQEHDNRLSYYDFFTYLEKDLELALIDWEEDALQTFLDSQGMAFIEFNEFNEFLRDFGYNTGIKVDEDDLEAQLELKAAINYKDYEVTNDDYFMGCKTMLKSEKAALATCRNLMKQCKKTKQSKW